MANIDKLLPYILKWEGKFVNNPKDKGGPTNMGVTISTWKKVGYDKDGDGDIDVDDLKKITPDDVRNRVLKPFYWNRWKADKISNQNIANILVDWVWGSGKWGIIIPQRILGVESDGIVGRKTLSAINSFNPVFLFNKIKRERYSFLNSIVDRDPTQEEFLQGWINRLNDLRYA